MSKHEIKDERKIVDNAIQNCKGFIDALEWVKQITDDSAVNDKIVETEYLMAEYRERLHSIMIEEGRKEEKKNRNSKNKKERQKDETRIRQTALR
jgi:hypothetical protein